MYLTLREARRVIAMKLAGIPNDIETPRTVKYSMSRYVQGEGTNELTISPSHIDEVIGIADIHRNCIYNKLALVTLALMDV